MRFKDTERYVTTADLALAVTAAVTLERPLLAKRGPSASEADPGRQVALSLDMPMVEFRANDTTKATHGRRGYDAWNRLRDGHLGAAPAHDVRVRG